jgi:hypothetical protein
MNDKVIKLEVGQGRALSSRAEPLKWLDRNQTGSVLRNASTSLDDNVELVSILYRSCLQLFGAIWRQLNLECDSPLAQQARTRDNLSRLVLWGDLLDHGRLDACLYRATEIRDCVLEALHDIGKALIEGALDSPRHRSGVSQFLLHPFHLRPSYISSGRLHDLQIQILRLMGYEKVSTVLDP